MPLSDLLASSSTLVLQEPSRTTSAAALASVSQRLQTKLVAAATNAPRPRRGCPQVQTSGPLDGARVALLLPPGAGWLAACTAVWNTGGVVVPLSPQHPDDEWQHALQQSGTTLALCHAAWAPRVQGLDVDVAVVSLDDDALLASPIDTDTDTDTATPYPPDNGALVFFTSGTTGKPKAVLHTHRALQTQVDALVDAWRITADDVILHCLPLHHVHGIVNALLTVAQVGGTVRFCGPFAPDAFDRAAEMAPAATVFMAVPTIHQRLLDHLDATHDDNTRSALASCRLLISGSAALPRPLFARAEQAYGQPLLERYGMSEFGMGLSNPYDLDDRGGRQPGTVGFPFPHCEVRLRDEDGTVVDAAPGTTGELLMRGPHLFAGYMFDAAATASSFVDGWFCTGDRVHVDDDGRFAILGRNSIDILKTGGEKISALEIEAHYLGHDAVAQCAVIGVPHPDWGDEVVMAVVLRDGADDISLDAWRAFGKKALAVYKVPKRVVVVDKLPKNAMGKVQKRRLLPLLQEGGAA